MEKSAKLTMWAKEKFLNNENFFIQLIDWDGNQLWSYLLEEDICRLHHEQKILPNGNILCLCRETISNEENIRI